MASIPSSRAQPGRRLASVIRISGRKGRGWDWSSGIKKVAGGLALLTVSLTGSPPGMRKAGSQENDRRFFFLPSCFPHEERAFKSPAASFRLGRTIAAAPQIPRRHTAVGPPRLCQLTHGGSCGQLGQAIHLLHASTQTKIIDCPYVEP